MSTLVVMRHAKSDWTTELFDHERPLSARGERNAPAMAHWLLDSGYAPDRILVSSAQRTMQTAAAVSQLCGLDADAVDASDELYLAGSRTWLQAASEAGKQHQPEHLLLCGHNPGLDDLVDYLANGQAPLSSNGKLRTTAAAAVFDVADWADESGGSWTFVEIMRPRELSD